MFSGPQSVMGGNNSMLAPLIVDRLTASLLACRDERGVSHDLV
jgi:hypothetical protein